MKNIKYLVTALVVSMMLVGAAYASWTDTIFINGTVSTGTFDVDWVNPSMVAPDQWTKVTTGTPSVSTDGNTLTIGLEKLYPGAVFTGNVTLQNNGTIPAKFDSLTVTEVIDPTLDRATTDARTGVYEKLMIKLPGQSSFVYLKNLNTLGINEIANGGSHTLTGVQFKLDDNAGNATQAVNGVQFRITVNWKQ